MVGFKGKDATTKEISQLRNAIQSLTRTANPLGKLMNFLHEDLEAMQSELNMWINMKRQFREEIARQKKYLIICFITFIYSLITRFLEIMKMSLSP